jgi:ribosomal protein S12 methylthiotransferase
LKSYFTFLKEAQLDRVGCFKYSPVDGAKANDLPDPIDEDIKDIRLQRFMEVQSEISKQRLYDKIGSEYNIVIDSVDAEGAVGRTFGDAPEIDGVVHLNGVFDVQPGQRLWVEIIHTDEHDLWAVPVEEEYEQETESSGE